MSRFDQLSGFYKGSGWTLLALRRLGASSAGEGGHQACTVYRPRTGEASYGIDDLVNKYKYVSFQKWQKGGQTVIAGTGSFVSQVPVPCWHA